LDIEVEQLSGEIVNVLKCGTTPKARKGTKRKAVKRGDQGAVLDRPDHGDP
jgi:hypothetical protein